jgi:hypothetical protein
MLRSGITVLYAHWEGFISAGALSYLEYISNLNLEYRSLKVSFRAFAIRSQLHTATESSKIEKMINVANFLLNQQDEKCRIPYKRIALTRSNLNSRVFKDILAILSLDYVPYVTKEKLIDKTLLYFRNNIAHGKGLYPTYEQLEELFPIIISLMDLFKNQIENAAITYSYKIDDVT